MIEINLLPEEYRAKKKQFKMPELNLSFMPVALGVVFIMIVGHIILIYVISANKSAYGKMTKEWQNIGPVKKSIELIRRQNIMAKKNVDSIEALMKKKILWSEKLNQLSDLIIPGVWYTRIYTDKKTVILENKEKTSGKNKRGIKRLATKRKKIPYISIEGEVSSLYGEELAIIGKLIDRLKNDAEFFKDFSNIELDSTELHSIMDTDVMKFTVNCYFKEETEHES